MIIPPQSLSEEILDGILEEFISREGTDYGDYEWSLAEKLEQLKPQVFKGEVLVIFNEDEESVNLVRKEDYQEDQ